MSGWDYDSPVKQMVEDMVNSSAGFEATANRLMYGESEVNMSKFKEGDHAIIKAPDAVNPLPAPLKQYDGSDVVIKEVFEDFYLMNNESYWVELPDTQIIFVDKKFLSTATEFYETEEPNENIPPVIDKEEPKKNCFHIWEVVGHSPFSNVEWKNCKHCGIAKESV